MRTELQFLKVWNERKHVLFGDAISARLAERYLSTRRSPRIPEKYMLSLMDSEMLFRKRLTERGGVSTRRFFSRKILRALSELHFAI